ncbi:hypothetical protein PIB30_027881 [Stylosanthes scabra]|uniref:Zinc knuckle CX2CX4HX4C domain-containing protein n=1 Tax=Stylosanthes scabra TaxID=79078 RepID=A0ABU6X8D9_9FABA|nr:hypothetical protein [Stylosanthes scabra]
MRVLSCDRRAVVFVVEEKLCLVFMERTSRLSRISGYDRFGMDRQLSRTQPCAAKPSHALQTQAAMRRKRKWRPVSTRIGNEMDLVERQEKRCGLCRQMGHTWSGCPNAQRPEAD